MPYRTTRETKLQAFFFKLAHRLIPCNRYLTTVRIKNNSACDHCDEEDSISHFFLKCPQVSDFWNKVSEWTQRHLDLSLSTLSVAEKLFGIDRSQQNRNARVINWLTLQVKHYIQKRKLFFHADLSLIGFLAEIRSYLATERMACSLENRPRKFNAWWKLYTALG